MILLNFGANVLLQDYRRLKAALLLHSNEESECHKPFDRIPYILSR